MTSYYQDPHDLGDDTLDPQGTVDVGGGTPTIAPPSAEDIYDRFNIPRGSDFGRSGFFGGGFQPAPGPWGWPGEGGRAPWMPGGGSDRYDGPYYGPGGGYGGGGQYPGYPGGGGGTGTGGTGADVPGGGGGPGGGDGTFGSSYGSPYDFNFPGDVEIGGGPNYSPYQFNFGPEAQLSGRAPLPGMGPLNDEMAEYARGWMQNPSRFDTKLMQDIGDLVDFELKRKGEAGFAGLDERMAQRGLTGSSVDAETSRRFASDLQHERQSRLTDKELELARTHAQDRMAALSGARGVSSDIFGQRHARSQLGERQRQFDSDFRIRQRAQRLQAEGMRADEAYRAAQFEEQQRQFNTDARLRQRAQKLQEQGMSADDAYRWAQLGLREDLGFGELDVRERSLEHDRRLEALRLLMQGMGSDIGIDADDIERIFNQ